MKLRMALLLIPIYANALEVGEYRRITPAVLDHSEIRRIVSIRPGPDAGGPVIIHDSFGDDNWSNVWERGEELKRTMNPNEGAHIVMVKKPAADRSQPVTYELSMLKDVIVDRTGKTVALEVDGKHPAEVVTNIDKNTTLFRDMNTFGSALSGLPKGSVTVSFGTLQELGVHKADRGGARMVVEFVRGLYDQGLASPQLAQEIDYLKRAVGGYPNPAQRQMLAELDQIVKPKTATPSMVETVRESVRGAIESAR